MKRSSAILLCVTLSGSLLLTACTPKTSVERHARQYVYAADDGFDPNFRTKKADSARLMVPFLQQFRDTGVKDRVEGLSRDEALKRAEQFRSEEFLRSIQSRERFAGRTYEDSSTPSAKGLKTLGDAIADTYLDGYQGRP
ncbi:Exc2 family lipoprotein [Salmonella enterica]|nr:Exc2 family lipoprotein [Salmonella enterica]EGI4047796.1 Exc2 family lipoprotein [Salmonella enterica]EGJ9850500.1 Exc2 family lipoprotein [Salmonella enterica]EHB3459937.1 Exc2 family lipoprotein [Salmonella enterica]EHE9143028.1 Exc2 family lipoprotein [Salmonella enterica]